MREARGGARHRAHDSVRRHGAAPRNAGEHEERRRQPPRRRRSQPRRDLPARRAARRARRHRSHSEPPVRRVVARRRSSRTSSTGQPNRHLPRLRPCAPDGRRGRCGRDRRRAHHHDARARQPRPRRRAPRALPRLDRLGSGAGDDAEDWLRRHVPDGAGRRPETPPAFSRTRGARENGSSARWLTHERLHRRHRRRTPARP